MENKHGDDLSQYYALICQEKTRTLATSTISPQKTPEKPDDASNDELGGG